MDAERRRNLVKTRTYRPRCGDDIRNAAARLCLIANTPEQVRFPRSKGRRIRRKWAKQWKNWAYTPTRMEFNGQVLTADRVSTPDALVAAFFAECTRASEAWEASTEGQEHARRADEYRRKASIAAAEGILPFALADAAIWQSWVDANQDGYGACTMRYAARWANIMDARIAEGAGVADIAKDASHEADVEGITGFMYGAAVGMLAKAWVHGESLRRWHNRDTQIGTEGDRANETGGVLNPALLSVSDA